MAILLVVPAMSVSVVISGRPASANPNCPTIDGTTGAVSPLPAPGDDWSDCSFDNIHTGQTAVFPNGTDFTGVDLYDASMQGADVENATFNGGPEFDELEGINFNHANLYGSGIYHAYLYDQDFAGATLLGLRSADDLLQGAGPTLPQGWRVASHYLIGPGANLSGDNLGQYENIPFSLAGADLEGANLSGAVFDLTDLTGTDFTNAILTGANMQLASWSTTILTGVRSGSINYPPASLPLTGRWSMVI